VGIQFALLPIFLGLILYAMKPFGAEWTATAGAGFRVLQQTLLPMVALGHAASAVAGQCFGAKKMDRVASASWVSTRWMLVYGLFFTLTLFFSGRQLGHIFATTESGLDLAQIYYWWSAPTVLAFSLSFVPSSVLQALSRPGLPLLAALARIIVLTALVLWVIPTLGLGPRWVFGASSATTFIEGGLGTWLMWRHLRVLQKEPARPDSDPTSSEAGPPPAPSDSSS
jgi:Na+-driven multidrug efflux pump